MKEESVDGDNERIKTSEDRDTKKYGSTTAQHGNERLE